MPLTNKGNSCDWLTVQTSKQTMQIVNVVSGSLKPVSACQNDKSLHHR
ncbi:Protein of unknown function [Paraburkholderia caballeronis]|uniref:Uncharacterized protein n=2 Tax=Paraburkholderia caballeronis TaxID=416943 RepID=A0A1H7MSK7_9BURK|nr:uncharacterized protein DUF4087 [Paraburkholderia caballeronis]PXX01993.1 uncharacterized protein DUF4087 [Paraburkholderia caballeronis]RAK01150.1 uncharacterized protein DUF4087 [Paraburkholderia caballeronis]SEB95103.1 Protein of unknown function [Paraburkholderia caballeronis]SEL14039.1 Protein of unknown function [Paraburkholderia caballeronis]